MLDLQIVMLASASVLGALIIAVLGWLESGETFNGRTFSSSILRAIIAGIVSAIGFSSITNPILWDYIVAFLAGAGIDAAGKRISGAINARNITTTPE
jgi:hypothetical protein